MGMSVLGVEFDFPFRVGGDGSVMGVADVYAPVVYHDAGTDVRVDSVAGEWEPFSAGYTGQWGYAGPVMHASETLGGRLVADMIADGGVFVVTVVEVDGGEPAGWIVLRHKGG